MELKYLITGTGRSGTVFMSRLLTSCGILCGHESIFTNQGLEEAKKRLSNESQIYDSQCSGGRRLFFLEADASYMAAPYLKEDILKYTQIIHVVRNPIQVINSFVAGFGYFGDLKDIPTGPGSRYQTFIYSHVPELKEDMDPWTRACLYYVKWNEMIEENSTFRYRIEDKLSHIINFIGVDGRDCYKDVNANKCKYEIKCSPSDIPESIIKDQFIEMGKRYGYF